VEWSAQLGRTVECSAAIMANGTRLMWEWREGFQGAGGVVLPLAQAETEILCKFPLRCSYAQTIASRLAGTALSVCCNWDTG